MFVKRGNKTIYPNDLCHKCSESYDCPYLFQLVGLLDAFGNEVQVIIDQCDKYKFMDYRDEEETEEDQSGF